MNVNTDSLVTFIIVWGILIFSGVRGYLKMNTEDKKSAFNDFRSRQSIFTIVFIVMGGFLTHLGSLLTISIIKLIGLIILLIGGIFSTVEIWKERKAISIVVFVLISIVILLNVN